MYFFFSEFNKTARVDEEPYRARIGRICTVRGRLRRHAFAVAACHFGHQAAVSAPLLANG